MRDQILISTSYQTYCQMKHMLYGTTAFNQPLAFDTAKVTTVRENIYYLEFNRNE